jgi:YesN/AraC family two-component response regulator
VDALKLIEEHKDKLVCIISDYEMPGANGFEFRKMTTKVTPDVPFIILSGPSAS